MSGPLPFSVPHRAFRVRAWCLNGPRPGNHASCMCYLLGLRALRCLALGLRPGALIGLGLESCLVHVLPWNNSPCMGFRAFGPTVEHPGEVYQSLGFSNVHGHVVVRAHHRTCQRRFSGSVRVCVSRRLSRNTTPKKSYYTGFLSGPIPIRVSGVRGPTGWVCATINIVYLYFSFKEHHLA